jgi:hypothetical protein
MEITCAFFAFGKIIVISLVILRIPKTLMIMIKIKIFDIKNLPALMFNASSSKFYLLIFVLFFASLSHTAQTKICDKKTTVYFETDKSDIQASEETKLRNLTKQFSQTTDTFLLEVYAYTDSVASVKYNLKLAQKRFKSIATYLKENSAAHFEIREKVRGEAAPLGDNGTEEGRAKNRRVEIFYFMLSGTTVTLKGKGGMEMLVSKNYFAPRSICECKPTMTEIYTDAESARAGIGLTTADGCPLTTGGMISLNFDGQDKNGCTDVIFRIPGNKYDKDMEVWNSASQDPSVASWVRESSSQLEYDEITKYYTLTVKYCPGSKINLDKIVGPIRGCGGSGGSIDGESVSNSGYADSAAAIAVPELIRSGKFKKFRTVRSNVLTKNGLEPITIVRKRYRGRDIINFADSGMSKEKIGYYFSGPIGKYEMECDSGRCNRLNECWCFEIPLSAYTKIIYFQKKKYQLKVPLKYRNYTAKLFVPGADSVLTMDRVKGKRRKYKFELPVPDTYVVLYKDGSDLTNKRGYEKQVDLSKVHKRYAKRKKVYKAKVRGTQLKRST